MLLKVDGLFKAFNETVVLNDINFSLNPGEIVSLVGKSGAGKTTILRCVTGLESCDKGTIMVDDKYLCKYENNTMTRATKSELFEIRRSMGMVFQNYHLFPHMTVLENVMLSLTEVYHKSKQEAMDISIKMLEDLDLGTKLNQKPFELSGGQKQRVAIARSCVTNPKLLCFDEPTAALDSALILDIIRIIQNLAKNGMGILIISHDEKFVRDVSNRILMIENGKITAEFAAEEYSKRVRA